MRAANLRAAAWLALASSMVACGADVEHASASPKNLADPTFSRDVAPILFDHCVVCHREGESAPFPLWTYADAKNKRRQIVRVTRRGLMPPWLPEEGHVAFRDERHLEPQAVETLARWVDAGAPEGDPAELPPRPQFARGWQRGTPDLLLRLSEPFDVPADGPELIRNFIIEVPTDRLRYVEAVEIRPRSRAVHHGILQLDLDRRSRSLVTDAGAQGFDGMSMGYSAPPDGHFIGWTPGKRPTVVPPGMPWRLRPGSDLILQLHLTPTGKVETLQPEIGLYFTDEPPRVSPFPVVLFSEDIDIPAGEPKFVLEDQLRLPVAAQLFGIYPHAHYLCREMLAVAELPGGDVRTLLKIDSWDFDWQDEYRLAQPMHLPAGTVLRFRYVYDNSSGNSANPHVPPRRVQFGQSSTDEMGTLGLALVPDGADGAERSANIRALEEAVVRRTLEKKPYDWASLRKLGRALLDRNEPARAVEVLERALRLQPDYADAAVDLGASYLEMGQVEAADGALRKALAIDPSHALGKLILARVLAAKSDFAAAEAMAMEALEQAPSLVAAHTYLGTLLARRGDTATALEHFERALALSPSTPQNHNNVATARFALGDLEGAREHYVEAVALDPAYFNAWFNLGRVQSELGNAAESRQALDRARALNPDHPGLRELGR